MRLANRHLRLYILKSGIGVGGHCITVDSWFIFGAIDTDVEDSAQLIRTSKFDDHKP